MKRREVPPYSNFWAFLTLTSGTAERDPGPILPAKIETLLFGALDSETDAATALQLQATIQTLLAAGAPTRPSHYLASCSSVILAATAASNTEAAGGKPPQVLQGKSCNKHLTPLRARTLRPRP